MNAFHGYLIGLIFGVIAGVWVMFLIAGDDYTQSKQYRMAIAICQNDLPRSQKCIITAVPEVAE